MKEHKYRPLTFMQKKALGRGMACRMLKGGVSLLGNLLTQNEFGNTDYVQPVLRTWEADELRKALAILRPLVRKFDSGNPIVRDHYLKGEEHWKTVRDTENF